MDWTTPLKAQQQDFYSRFLLDNLLYCPTNYHHSEVVEIKSNIIEKINVESILESEEIANKYNLTYPLKEVLETIFYRKLALEAFLSRFGNLVWIDNYKYQDNSLQSLTNTYFLLKKATQIRILLKIYQGDIKQIQYHHSPEELKNNQVIVYSFCPQKFKTNLKEYPVIFLGFLPVEYLIKNNKNIIVSLSDFLYIGGLTFFLNEVIPINYYQLKKALKYSNSGDYRESIKIYNQMIIDNPTHDKYYLLRGMCKYKLGDIQSALVDISQAINFNDRNALAFHWRGYLHQQLQNYSEALNNYTQEIVINPLNYFAYFNRGIIYLKLNQLINALEDYTMAIQINNSLFYAFYNRGFIYDKLGDKESAIEDYIKALNLQPNLSKAHYNLAIIYQQLGDYQQALKSYRSAIKISPWEIKSYYNLAILQADLGLYKQSINTYEIIKKIDPSFAPAIYNHNALSSLLQKEGNIILSPEDILSSSRKNNYIISTGQNIDQEDYYFHGLDSKQTHPFPLQ